MTLEELRRALPDTISTQDLLLRAPVLDDADRMQQLANNENIHKVLARLPHPYTHEHAIDFITNIARGAEDHAYAIVHGGHLIGVVGLSFTENPTPEIGYWLGEPHWGHGFATQAAKAVVGAARSIDSNMIIYARTITSNTGSRRVLAKTGFIETGERIDDCGQHKGVKVTFMSLGGD